ncbi:RNase H domain-containing protein [Trichonephila clavipes]|nr:RNase H domain-containing protein [Trichonephila clavipes]
MPLCRDLTYGPICSSQSNHHAHHKFEYGFPIFCCSSDSNFQKLERVELSAVRIITGLRNSCPKDIVLYKADLQPISLRRNACLVEYYSRLSGLGFQNRTSKFLRPWISNQRFKRDSPLVHVASGHLVASSIEHQSLSQVIDSSEGLDGVYFHVDLSIQVSKQKELLCYLKQLALERVNNVPKDAVHMYTDGSKLGSDSSGSGIYISFWDQEIKIQRKKSGLLLGISFRIQFQWIPSHVDNAENEIVDSLAKAGAGITTTPATPLTYLELFSKYKAKNKVIWMVPWYQRLGSRSPIGFGLLQGEWTHGPDLALLISGMRNNNNTMMTAKCRVVMYECDFKVMTGLIWPHPWNTPMLNNLELNHAQQQVTSNSYPVTIYGLTIRG